MNSNVRRAVGLAVIAVVFWNGLAPAYAATKKESNEALEMMNSYEAEQRAAEKARGKDPAWQASCKEINLIKVGDGKSKGQLKNL